MWKQLIGHKERARKFWYRNAHKIVMGMVGGSILIIGIAMIVLPGPATLFIPLGIALLGTEFIWAKRFLRRSKSYLKEKLPDYQGPRINKIFAWVRRVSLRIAKWMHDHVVKPLTPRRKRV